MAGPDILPGSDLPSTGAKIAAVAHNAGFSGNALTVAVAVAKAESGWNARAKGGPNSNGTYDWGLWQINDVHKPSEAQKVNAVENAKVAFKVYRDAGNSFRPWAAFNSGAYKAHMPAATQAVAELRKRGPQFERDTVAFIGSAISNDGTGNPISDIKDAIVSPAESVAKNVATFAGKVVGNYLAFVLALVLLILGVFLITRTPITKTAVKAAKTVAKRTPAGRAVKAAAPVAKPAARVAKTVEQRAAESVALSEARKRLIEKQKADKAKEASNDFLAKFRENQAAYRQSRGVDVVTGKRNL